MSSADAWMPLYIGDYLASTAHLSAAEHGAYLLLIMHYWRNGGLPTEAKMLARIAKMLPAEWEESSAIVLGFFVPTQTGYSHARIDKELAKAKDKSEKAKASVAERERRRQSSDDPTINERSSDDDRTIISSPSQSPSLAPNVTKERSRVRAPARDSAEFENWYAAFPIHEARANAERAYWKARAKVGADVLLDGANRYRAKTSGTEKRYIAHPASWLNAGRWADEDLPPGLLGAVQTQPDEQWRQRMRSLQPAPPGKPFWASSWGPRPGELGCQVPSYILAEFGFGQSEAA